MTLTVTELSQSREIARCVGGLMLGAQIHELRDIVDVIQANEMTKFVKNNRFNEDRRLTF